jgi:O-antigen/teichoic acid export membrane protein
MQTLLGIVAAVALVLLAEPIAGAFKSPELLPVILYMSPVVILSASAGIPLSLLRRDLRFGRTQIVQVSASTIAFLFVGIPLALADFGVWSLVSAYFSQSLLELALAYLFTRHSLVPKFTLPDKYLFNFGKTVFLINLVNYGIQEAQNLIIGRYYGMGDLGSYNRAQALIRISAAQIVGTYRPILFSMYSRAQDRAEMVSAVYFSVLSLISVTVWPPLIVMAVLSEALIKGLFGEAWLGAIPLLVPLALAQSVQVVTGTCGPILWATGRPEEELKISALTLAVLVVVLGAMSQVSLLAVAWGMFAVHACRFVLMTRAIHNQFGIRLHQFYLTTRGGILMSLVCAGAAFAADQLLADINIAPIVLLILESGLVGLVYVLACKLTNNDPPQGFLRPERFRIARGSFAMPRSPRPWTGPLACTPRAP